METMQPSIMLGSYTWAEDRLPIDEFRLRVAAAKAQMSRNGWAGLLVYGDAREHAALAYLTNFIPRMRWGMALVPADGEPRLLCSMSSRDIPAMRTMTWIADVRSGWEWEKAFACWFERFDGTAAAFGTIGFDLMPPPLGQSVRRSLGSRFALARADEVVRIPPPAKRPREISTIRRSCAVLEASARGFIDSWRKNRSPEAAALDGERIGRAMAAQDVRTLASFDGGRSFLPFQGRLEAKAEPLAGYLAVKVMGYWAATFVSAGIVASDASRRAEAALDALVAAIRPGAVAGDIHARGMAALAPFKLHPVLGGSVGHGIGLSLEEAPELRENSPAVLEQDGVYLLQVGIAEPPATGVFASAMVRNAATGAEVLARILPVLA